MYAFLFLLGLLGGARGGGGGAGPVPYEYVDPFAALERHVGHALAYHYLWPWSKLVRAAAALDAQEPRIVLGRDRFAVELDVRTFEPGELRVKVKDRYLIVEGKRGERGDGDRLVANHFVQRFALPSGTDPEEVTAVLRADGTLSVSAPRREPPPPPERDVPVAVEGRGGGPAQETAAASTAASSAATSAATSAAPLEDSRATETTTARGKIRKKELKTATKDNEVAKGGDDDGPEE